MLTYQYYFLLVINYPTACTVTLKSILKTSLAEYLIKNCTFFNKPNVILDITFKRSITSKHKWNQNLEMILQNFGWSWAAILECYFFNSHIITWVEVPVIHQVYSTAPSDQKQMSCRKRLGLHDPAKRAACLRRNKEWRVPT